MNIRVKGLIYCALFIALSIVFPMLFHSIGLGKVFLPMFWPLAMIGYFINPKVALMAGLITPGLSLVLTGMPPVPVVWRMTAELGIIPFVTAILFTKTHWNAFLITPIALICGLLGGMSLSYLLAPLLGWPRWLYAFSSITVSLPGIIGISIAIPILYHRLNINALHSQNNYEQ
ncbi:ECF transporter S component [bacterium]|nr:ECF transporter S component [bacterium]